MEDVFSQLLEKQEKYFESASKYWQGIQFHDTIVTDKEERAAEITRKPVEQEEDWETMKFDFPKTFPCTLQVDIYDGPSGKGWALTGRVRINKIIYRRTMNYGPEEWREFPWDTESLE